MAAAGLLAAVLWSRIRAPTPVVRAAEPVAKDVAVGREEPPTLVPAAGPLDADPRAAGAETPTDAEARTGRVRERASELASAIDPDTFDARAFETRAAAIASAATPAEVQEWMRLAAAPDLKEAERVAVAEVLRHVTPQAKSGEVGLHRLALTTLRRAWMERAEDPTLAQAAAAALGAFGDQEDRRAMLDVLASGAPATDLAIARAALGAARGDEAALQMMSAAESSHEHRVLDAALSAVTAMSADGRGLSPESRAQCAASVERMLASGGGENDLAARLASTLAALDAARAVAPLAALLGDPRSGDSAAQSAAVTLATIPSSAEALDRITMDEKVPMKRRVLAAVSRLRTGGPEPAAARSLLVQVRDGGVEPALQRQAARALELADANRVQPPQ